MATKPPIKKLKKQTTSSKPAPKTPVKVVLPEVLQKELDHYEALLNDLPSASLTDLRKMLVANFDDPREFAARMDIALPAYNKLSVQIVDHLPLIALEFVARKKPFPKISMHPQCPGLPYYKYTRDSLETCLLDQYPADYKKLAGQGLVPYSQWPYQAKYPYFSNAIPKLKAYKKPISHIYYLLCHRFMGEAASVGEETVGRIKAYINHSEELMKEASEVAKLAMDVIASKQLKPSNLLLSGKASAKDSLAKEFALFMDPADAKAQVEKICSTLKQEQTQYVDRTPWFTTLFHAIDQKSDAVLKTVLPAALLTHPELAYTSFINKMEGHQKMRLEKFKGFGLLEYAIETESLHCLGTLITHTARIPESVDHANIKPVCKNLISPFLMAAAGAEKRKNGTPPSFELFAALRALTAKELTEHYGYSFEEAKTWIDQKVTATSESKKVTAIKSLLERWVLEHTIKPVTEEDIRKLGELKQGTVDRAAATTIAAASVSVDESPFPISARDADEKRREARAQTASTFGKSRPRL